MALNEKYKKELIKIIHQHLPNATVYLFGSRAIDKETVGSDIDIALDAGKLIDPDILTKIELDFDETTIPMKMDLVDLHRAQKELKNDILREGIKWTS